MNEAAHRHAFKLLVAIILAQIHFSLRAEEKEIRDGGLAVGAVGKAVNADVFRLFRRSLPLVEALEKAAVEEWNVFEKVERFARFLKHRLVTIENMRHEVIAVFPPGALVHFGVKRGKKKILQDSFVKNGLLGAGLCRLETGEGCGEFLLVEKRIRNEPLFLHEPAEDKPRDEADDADVVVSVGFLGRAFREGGVFQGPEVPVRNFGEEILCDRLDIESRVAALLDRQRRDAEQFGMNLGQVEKLHPLRRRA
ncbi:MAG: hypothetical protein WCT12_20180 [Verrucomicrobiota bacterium]